MHGVDDAVLVLADEQLGQVAGLVADAATRHVLDHHAHGAECAKALVALVRLAGAVREGRTTHGKEDFRHVLKVLLQGMMLAQRLVLHGQLVPLLIVRCEQGM